MAKAIDIHAHVFNIRYLPVAGILDGSGMIDLPRWLAKALAILALAATPTDRTLDQKSTKASVMDADVTAEAALINRLIDGFDERIEEIEARIPSRAWANRDVQRALKRARTMVPPAMARGPRLRMLIALARRIIEGAGGIARAVDWLFSIATARERTIVRILLDTYGDDVELFVHHMMDMKNHYRNGATKYDFSPRQVNRMETLAQVSGGRLAAFVAWDPFREDGLSIVQDAIDNHGCIGVKFYPPSGYRPFGNDGSDLWRRHVEPPAPEVLNRRMLALFKWCIGRDLPVFTHCTPSGFQAYKKSGDNCAPAYWRDLLTHDRAFKTLRLCFGHAGGEGWFATNEAGWSGTFAKDVAYLCSDTQYPNLYCEVGILSDVHDSGARGRFAARLRAIAGERPELLKRLLYGSDWHMLFMHAGHRDFFRDYELFCGDAGFTPEQRADFFRENAVRYLN